MGRNSNKTLDQQKIELLANLAKIEEKAAIAEAGNIPGLDMALDRIAEIKKLRTSSKTFLNSLPQKRKAHELWLEQYIAQESLEMFTLESMEFEREELENFVKNSVENSTENSDHIEEVENILSRFSDDDDMERMQNALESAKTARNENTTRRTKKQEKTLTNDSQASEDSTDENDSNTGNDLQYAEA